MESFNKLAGHYRTFVSLCLALLFLYLARPNTASIILGLVLVIAGELIRAWASGFLNKDTHEYVTVFGPYAYSRNPLYLGNFLLGLGFICMGNYWAAIVLFLILFFIIYRATILDEEKLLTRMFGNPYIEYRRSVPRFFPHLKPAGISSNIKVLFSWKQVCRREYKAWTGIVIVLAFLIYRASVLNP
ncbi:MAG TPA: isoprenylcysteine carboxylmethyltransferase family protein [Nitrospiria bacterium]|nr:isoprenylcysteine carboxylmethyltransferase family protein [Nitrospiria bacterium]